MRTWPESCSVILINEVAPRAKKLGLTIEEFCNPSAIGALARLEHEGIISRKTLREILDERVKVIQDENAKIPD